MATVVEEAERLDALVTNLLAMTRLELGTVEIRKRDEPIDEVIAAALHRISGRLHGRSVTTDVPEAIPLVPMDPMLIEQVLINLLENALKYTPEASPLVIRVLPEDTGVRLELLDSGPGVPVEEQEKVFDKFYRGKRVPKGDGGVGLGLTICRAIIDAHGGHIWMEDRPSGGARVQFTLPRSVPVGAAGDLPEVGASEKLNP
jgi:two-component system sensor histidine kinase KdpD